MSDYAHAQLMDKTERPFDDTISPPLFLMLTLMIVHLLAVATHNEGDHGTSPLAQLIFSNEQTLLIYRSVGYSIWPLLFAVGALRDRGEPLDRNTLRRPFFAQCFFAVPFALGLNIGLTLVHMPSRAAEAAGLLLMLGVMIWYIVLQARWLRHTLGYGWLKAGVQGVGIFAVGVLINIGAALLIFRA